MSIRHAILGLLEEERGHGYDLKEIFEERVGGFWSLNYGQIYQTLDRLDRDGLVECEVVTGGENGTERKIYRITPRGQVELKAWLKEPVPRPRPLRDEFFVKLLFLGANDPEAVLRLIEQHKETYLQHMQSLTDRKFQLSRRPDPEKQKVVTDLLIDAALFHAEADIHWLNHSEQRLRRLWADELSRSSDETR